MLSRLAKVLAQEQPAKGDARLIVLAAARLGGLPFECPPTVDRAVSATVEIFQQDRMLQTGLEGAAGIRAIAEALRADGAARTSYEEHLKLMSRLTNSLV